VHRRPVVGVPALEALAHAVSGEMAPGTVVAAWMDAQRKDVFAAVYRVTHAMPFFPERLETLEGPTVGDPVSILSRWRGSLAAMPAVVVGDGALLYVDTIAGAIPDARTLPPPLLAGTVGRLAAVRARRGDTIAPMALHPLYVRRPDVEVVRDERRPSSC
jgi:tRNA A37 threonylcarbamoyladenosine modification protein TsaB